MTETATPAYRPQGPTRQPGTKALRPRFAATMLIVRQDGPEPQVLMGRRHGGHAFMPNLWVFPGGRIDPADYRAPHATELSHQAASVFTRHMPLNKARALAMAAVRETWEEAGLLLARPAPARPAAGPWRSFLAEGAAPDLSALEVLARAITPPMLAKRFDTWFLMADAGRLMSLERKPDCGELEEIAWKSFDESLELPLPHITRRMVTHLRERLADPAHPPLFFRFAGGKPRWGEL